MTERQQEYIEKPEASKKRSRLLITGGAAVGLTVLTGVVLLANTLKHGVEEDARKENELIAQIKRDGFTVDSKDMPYTLDNKRYAALGVGRCTLNTVVFKPVENGGHVVDVRDYSFERAAVTYKFQSAEDLSTTFGPDPCVGLARTDISAE